MKVGGGHYASGGLSKRQPPHCLPHQSDSHPQVPLTPLFAKCYTPYAPHSTDECVKGPGPDFSFLLGSSRRNWMTGLFGSEWHFTAIPPLHLKSALGTPQVLHFTSDPSPLPSRAR